MTQSLEDYLETIYLIGLDKKVVRVKDISEKLAVKKPSVIKALRELSTREYIEHERYGYIELTQTGLKEAKIILEKHRMLKSFLINYLGVPETIAEKDACCMEHILSPETLSGIEHAMKNKLNARNKE